MDKVAQSRTAEALSPALEDYLEAVLDLVRVSKVARVRDIARRLGVGMPSVSSALRVLGRRGLVNYDPYQVITLTGQGQKLARNIDQRHRVLERFLTDVLGLGSALARSNACRMEHAIDQTVLERLSRFAQFVQDCPRTGKRWSEAFGHHDWRSYLAPSCRRCLRSGGSEARPKATAARPVQ